MCGEYVERGFTERLPVRQSVRSVLSCGGTTPTAGTGVISLVIQGVPQGDADVRGANYLQANIRNSTILTGVPTGEVSVSAREIVIGSAIYRWRANMAAPEASVNYTLGAYAPLNVVVDYEPVPGGLEVEVVGLPSGVTATLNPAGPSTNALTLTNGLNRFELPPGDYSLNFQDVAVGPGILRPTLANRSVSLASGATERIQVQYRIQSATATINVQAEGDYGNTNPTPMVCLKINGQSVGCPF